MASSMQQYVSHFDGPDGLKKEAKPMQSPGTKEVLVQINAVSLNYRDVEGTRAEVSNPSPGGWWGNVWLM